MSFIYEDTKRRYAREGEERGEEKGTAETYLKTVKAAMTKMNITVEEAFDLLDVPDIQRESIRFKLNIVE